MRIRSITKEDFAALKKSNMPSPVRLERERMIREFTLLLKNMEYGEWRAIELGPNDVRSTIKRRLQKVAHIAGCDVRFKRNRKGVILFQKTKQHKKEGTMAEYIDPYKDIDRKEYAKLLSQLDWCDYDHVLALDITTGEMRLTHRINVLPDEIIVHHGDICDWAEYPNDELFDFFMSREYDDYWKSTLLYIEEEINRIKEYYG